MMKTFQIEITDEDETRLEKLRAKAGYSYKTLVTMVMAAGLPIIERGYGIEWIDPEERNGKGHDGHDGNDRREGDEG